MKDRELQRDNPLQIAIGVNREFMYSGQVPPQESVIIDSTLNRVLQFKHEATHAQILDGITSIQWLLDHRRIAVHHADEQLEALRKQELYTRTLMDPNYKTMQERRLLPPFILQGVENVQNRQPSLQGMQDTTRQIKDLSVFMDTSFESAAHTVNALVPLPLEIDGSAERINLHPDDLRTATLRIARLVDLGELTGDVSYSTLLAMLIQYDRVRRIEMREQNIADIRTTAAGSVIFIGGGSLLSLVSVALGFNAGDITLGLIGAVPGLAMDGLGISFFALARREMIDRGIRLQEIFRPSRSGQPTLYLPSAKP